jgi:hypothetical protein
MTEELIDDTAPEPKKHKLERCGAREKPKQEYLGGVELRKF